MSEDRKNPADAGRDERGRFAPGNPGRKPGMRHAALAALDAIGQEGAEAVMRSVVRAAMEGDMRAADILLRRLWPERKGRAVPFDLSRLETAADVVRAAGDIAHAVATGQLTPEEGQAVAAVIETHRRALETVELEGRISRLEAATKGMT